MRLEASFICDDIRSEIGRKVSLMGIYDEKILLPSFPARLAKVCLFQRWSEIPRGAKVFIELQGTAMVTPARTEPRAIKADDEILEAAMPALVTARLVVALTPVDIAAEGNLEFLTYWEGSSTPQHTHVLQVGRMSEEEALKFRIR
jgi:hypothetical protein